MDRLRGEPEMAHHGDVGREQPLDCFETAPTAFELHRLAAPFAE
jgi:hypothetical protein